MVVTRQFENLKQEPQTSLHRGDLTPEERSKLRVLRVQGAGKGMPNFTETFTTIYYLAGDERQAAKQFVEENREQLETIDFSKPDAIQSSVSREIYDWILHFLGERVLRKYQTVVYEQRPTDTWWVIDREHFETEPVRRYSTTRESARVEMSSPESLYDEFGTEIMESDLEAHDAVAGDVKYVLEYYRVAGPYDCEPITVDSELAVRKQ